MLLLNCCRCFLEHQWHWIVSQHLMHCAFLISSYSAFTDPVWIGFLHISREKKTHSGTELWSQHYWSSAGLEILTENWTKSRQGGLKKSIEMSSQKPGHVLQESLCERIQNGDYILIKLLILESELNQIITLWYMYIYCIYCMSYNPCCNEFMHLLSEMSSEDILLLSVEFQWRVRIILMNHKNNWEQKSSNSSEVLCVKAHARWCLWVWRKISVALGV